MSAEQLAGDVAALHLNADAAADATTPSKDSFHQPGNVNHSSSPLVAAAQSPLVDDDDTIVDNLQLLASTVRRTNSGDAGSDSGVDIDVATNTNNTVNNPPSSSVPVTPLQRALSSTSGGYASSCGGLDAEHDTDDPMLLIGGGEPSDDPLNTTNGTSTTSCNSSMISYNSELGAAEPVRTGTTLRRHRLDNSGSACSSSANAAANQDCTSEGGSESSSITGGPVQRKSSIVRKKVALIEPPASALLKSARKDDNAVARSRARTASANRTALQAKTPQGGGAPVLLSMERARSRDKTQATSGSLPPSSRSTPLKRLAKQDSMPQTPRTPGAHLARTPSIPRGRGTAVTPTHSAAAAGEGDGRWPSSVAPKPISKTGSATATSSAESHLIIKTKMGPMCLDQPSSKSPSSAANVTQPPPDKSYATLPRRRKEKSDDDLRSSAQRSTSAQRDRMATSLIKRQLSKETATPGTPSSSSSRPSTSHATPTRRSTLSGIRAPPSVFVVPQKTRIYHETGVQTMLLEADIAAALAGCHTAAAMRPIDAVDTETRACQVDIRDAEIELLQEQLRRSQADVVALQTALGERGQQLVAVEQQLGRERDERQAMRSELQSNTQRVLGMLALVQQHAEQGAAPLSAAEVEEGDSLLMLESQIQQSGHALEAKQCEIEKLYDFCRRLQAEMQRSQSVQRSLLVEKNELEKESTELQVFLQEEKTTLVDALRDAEQDSERVAALMVQREADIERLQEECRHLVRISEQRRHEFLGMQSKYMALELRSKDLIVQQGSAVSGASMALAGLGARLDQLVEQLIGSYSISEQELEDVVYHNEAYTAESAASSAQATPDGKPAAFGDGSLSPQRHQSFIVAVISAIRNAASTAKHSVVQHPQQQHQQQQHHPHHNTHPAGAKSHLTNGGIDQLAGDESDTTEMLDSETEPCLMMENVLEDVSMPDTHSHNLVSSSTVLPTPPVHLQLTDVACPMQPPPPTHNADESIHNLSQAILDRQQIEQQASRLVSCRPTRTASEHSNGSATSGGSNEDEHELHVESAAEMPSMASCEYSCAQPLVDQIIGVDNLVTKLLKVLRIIQMDNDNCIQQLIGDKNALQLNKEELQLKLHDWEQLNGRMRCDLDTASGQLKSNSSELAHSRVELQRHRAEIDRLNVDICNLSTLCQNTATSTTTTTTAKPDAAASQNVLHAIARWQTESKDCAAEPNVLAQLVDACQENPQLKQQLFGDLMQSGGLMSNGGPKPSIYRNLQEAIVDTKRQYEAIDRALETLNAMPGTVQQCPALLALQRDLEETNFQSASNIPIYTAILSAAASDCNANAQPHQPSSATTNGAGTSTAGGGSLSPVTANSSPGRILRVDSTA